MLYFGLIDEKISTSEKDLPVCYCSKINILVALPGQIYRLLVTYLPDSNSFHPPNPRAAKALLMFICDDFLLLKMGSTVGILDPMIKVFGK